MEPIIGIGKKMRDRLKKHKINQRGFTLFELLAVMAILGILAAIAVPSYKRSQIKASESVLAEDLYQMRRALDAFYSDKQRYPNYLKELIEQKYLRDMPRDPFTHNNQTWSCLPPLPSDNGQLAEGNCFDVRSGSDLIGLNDIPYREW